MVTHPKHNSLLTLPVQTTVWKSFITDAIMSLFMCSLFLTISFCTTSSFAQVTYEQDKTTRFEKIGVDEGLSSRYITSIHQDNYGFIWIGTQNGLNLYDGIEFKIFRSEVKNPNSLPDNYIYKILEGKDSTLWICSEYGLSRYSRASENFTNFYPDTTDHYNPINSIREIYELEDNLMLNAGGMLYKFDTRTLTFFNLGIELIPEADEIWTDPVTMLPDTSGMLWVFSNNNGHLVVNKYIPKNNEFQKYFFSGKYPISFWDLNLTSFFKSGPNTFWLGTFGNGLIKLTV